MKTNLQELRKMAGFRSAREFAEHLGIPVPTYTAYEQGSRGMGMDVACDICDALGCTLDQLVGRAPVTRVDYYVTTFEELSDEGRQAVEDFAEFTRQREVAERARQNGDKKGQIA